MCALSSAVRPSAGGVPRRAAAAPSDAGDRASSGKMSRTHDSVVTAGGGKKSSQELLQKHQASELDAVRGLLKNAELTSRRGASKGGAPIADDRKEQFLAPMQRPKPMEDGGGNGPSVKRRKISTLVEQEKFAEESKDDKLADTDQIMGTSAQQPSEAPASATAESTAQEESDPSKSTGFVIYLRPNKPVFVRPVIDMAGLIYKAKLRKQQLDMERAAQPDQSISEYGHPMAMRQLGLVLKADA